MRNIKSSPSLSRDHGRLHDLRQTLIDQVKTYTDAFAEWMASAAKIARSNAIISAETRQMIPAADEIIASANDKAQQQQQASPHRRNKPNF